MPHIIDVMVRVCLFLLEEFSISTDLFCGSYGNTGTPGSLPRSGLQPLPSVGMEPWPEGDQRYIQCITQSMELHTAAKALTQNTQAYSTPHSRSSILTHTHLTDSSMVLYIVLTIPAVTEEQCATLLSTVDLFQRCPGR